MALMAPVAPTACLVRIDGNELAARETELLDVLTEIAAELMPGDKGFVDKRAADAAVFSPPLP